GHQVGLVEDVVAGADESKARKGKPVVRDDHLVVAHTEHGIVLEEHLDGGVSDAIAAKGPGGIVGGRDRENDGRRALADGVLQIDREPTAADRVVDYSRVRLAEAAVHAKEASQAEGRARTAQLVGDA